MVLDRTAKIEASMPGAAADLPQINLGHNGIGNSYAMGTIIGMLLQTQSPSERLEILADVIETLEVPKGELVDRLESYVCRHCVCRTSRLYPCDCGKPFNPSDALRVG